MFFQSGLLEGDFSSPLATWARAWRGVGWFQCGRSVNTGGRVRKLDPPTPHSLPAGTGGGGPAWQSPSALPPTGLWSVRTILPTGPLPAPWPDLIRPVLGLWPQNQRAICAATGPTAKQAEVTVSGGTLPLLARPW